MCRYPHKQMEMIFGHLTLQDLYLVLFTNLSDQFPNPFANDAS